MAGAVEQALAVALLAQEVPVVASISPQRAPGRTSAKARRRASIIAAKAAFSSLRGGARK
jgi:hypothetical protein